MYKSVYAVMVSLPDRESVSPLLLRLRPFTWSCSQIYAPIIKFFEGIHKTTTDYHWVSTRLLACWHDFAGDSYGIEYWSKNVNHSSLHQSTACDFELGNIVLWVVFLQHPFTTRTISQFSSLEHFTSKQPNLGYSTSLLRETSKFLWLCLWVAEHSSFLYLYLDEDPYSVIFTAGFPHFHSYSCKSLPKYSLQTNISPRQLCKSCKRWAEISHATQDM